MELLFLALLVGLMAFALGSGFPVAFALPGSAIISIAAAALTGLIVTGDAGIYFLHGGPVEWLSAGVTNLRGVYWEPERDTLIAIPLFVFMGIMLQRSKIAEDLLVTMAQLFGPMPGGLGISVVFVGALLAATTGILGATVVAMGLISLPAMMRNNYSHSLAAGTIAASGTLGQIIPPSIVLIILADQLSSAVDQASTARTSLYQDATGEFAMPSAYDVTSTSAGDMFLGAILPGMVLVGLYMAAILVTAILRPEMAPPVRFEGRMDLRFALRCVVILVPPLGLIFAVLGSILLGVATVNQAGAIGAVGATIMAGYRLNQDKRGAAWPLILGLASIIAIIVLTQTFEINVKNIQTERDQLGVTLAAIAVAGFLISLAWSLWRTLKLDETLTGVMVETAKTTSLVFIILLGAAMLTAAFRAFGGEDLVKDFLGGLPGGFWTQFAIVMAVIFVLGFFLDFIEIAVVVVPIVAPILLADPSANITAVWLGVMIGLNIQTSFLTPPFGFALFYLRGVAPAAVRTVQIYKGVIPFIALQLVALAVVAALPPLVNYLPMRSSLLAETAPPPQNPRLQQCLEAYLFDVYRAEEGRLTTAIATAQALDISYLPRSIERDLSGSFEKAAATFGMIDEIDRRQADVDAAIPDYKPLHREVRTLERLIRRNEDKIAVLDTRISRLRSDEPAIVALRSELEAERAGLQAEMEELAARIPTEWDARHDAFATLDKAAEDARRDYRRNVDDAYEPIGELVAIVRDADRLATLAPAIRAVPGLIATGEPEAALAEVERLRDELRDVEGADDIRDGLSDARRRLRGRRLDPERAAEEAVAAVESLEADLAWRTRAASELLPGLAKYEAEIRSTIGLRQQDRMPRAVALDVAACSANHQDISLHF